MNNSSIERTITYAVLILAAAFALYPMLVILFTAIQPESIGASGVDFGNFATAWDRGNFGTYLKTSVIVTVSVVILSTLLACLAGYAFGTMRFRGSSVLFYLLLLGLMVPSEAIVIPLYFGFQELDLLNSYPALIFPQVAQSLAFGTFWMRAYFRSSQAEVVEAARLDGAGHFRIFWSILVPMGRPAIITMMVLVFMWTWNEFLLPLVMVPTEESMRTAPLGLATFQGQYTSGTALLAAGAVLVALPVIVFYIFAQRHFIRGMVEGSVKG
ncbi:carbohydrate ABC transporter permease [Solicola gregarius]|uniref:Carbohydrate ABC transporter permease n=1 Tax=Solicola gregarius TaxID=2908642 RepID=A0AA46TK45_9ACTN|nr:carbohydrate ABC transporter permease [Solicola gregarius]UYM06756.1 carbohydrate ABC transporter permease [Solicola gregarius]